MVIFLFGRFKKLVDLHIGQPWCLELGQGSVRSEDRLGLSCKVTFRHIVLVHITRLLLSPSLPCWSPRGGGRTLHNGLVIILTLILLSIFLRLTVIRVIMSNIILRDLDQSLLDPLF